MHTHAHTRTHTHTSVYVCVCAHTHTHTHTHTSCRLLTPLSYASEFAQGIHANISKLKGDIDSLERQRFTLALAGAELGPTEVSLSLYPPTL
jgi:hypothetical protein